MTTQETGSDPPIRILMIEDNEANRRLMNDYLSYCGYNVFALAEAQQFEPTMVQFNPQVILLDLKLPDVDGYSLLEQIQQHPDWRNIPVIIVSAYAFQKDQQRAFKLGARRYMVKPIRLSELIDVISEELTRLGSKESDLE